MNKWSYFFLRIGLLFGLVFSGECLSLQLFSPNSLGTVIVGTRQDASQMASSGMGPGILVHLKYNLSPAAFMSLGVGVGTVTDDFLKTENFKTVLLPSTELKFGLNLANETKLTPQFYTGLHFFGFMNKVYTPTGVVTSDQYYDSGIMIGGGIEYQSSEQWTFYVGGDYRYVITADQKPSPQYWVAQAGINFAIDHPPEKRLTDEYYQNEQGKNVGSTTEKRKLTEKQKRYLAYLVNKKRKAQQQKEEEAQLLKQQEASQSTQTETTKKLQNPGGEIEKVYSNIVNLENNMDNQNRMIDNLTTRVQNNEKVLSNVARMVVSDYYNNEIEETPVQQNISIVNFKESYQTALQKVRSNDYQGAIHIFNSLLVYDPKHKLASNCQYWIGEAYHAIGSYNQAITAFNHVLEYQISYKFDDALLMKGLCHLKMGEQNSAKKYFEELIYRYPESEYISRARNYLVSL